MTNNPDDETDGTQQGERQSNYLTPEQEAGTYSLSPSKRWEEIAQTHAENPNYVPPDVEPRSLDDVQQEGRYRQEIDQTHSEYPNVVPPGVEPSSLADLPQDQPAPPAAGPMPQQPPPISGLVDPSDPNWQPVAEQGPFTGIEPSPGDQVFPGLSIVEPAQPAAGYSPGAMVDDNVADFGNYQVDYSSPESEGDGGQGGGVDAGPQPSVDAGLPASSDDYDFFAPDNVSPYWDPDSELPVPEAEQGPTAAGPTSSDEYDFFAPDNISPYWDPDTELPVPEAEQDPTAAGPTSSDDYDFFAPDPGPQPSADAAAGGYSPGAMVDDNVADFGNYQVDYSSPESEGDSGQGDGAEAAAGGDSPGAMVGDNVADFGNYQVDYGSPESEGDSGQGDGADAAAGGYSPGAMVDDNVADFGNYQVDYGSP
ncbi:MAG: hypothetical protein ACLPYH_07215, partial [Mycobacterium sp.]